jgi:sterol desaturase/sphingolipid hydroxylase (fatty acid hydroxylase superfamily)
MNQLIENILHQYSYLSLFGLSFGYFLILYFALAPLFLYSCQFLERRKLLHKIEQKAVSKRQILYEMRNSLLSIVVFGFSIIPVIYFIRIDVIILLPNTFFNIALGVIILTLWNEIHFYLVHRLMHSKFFMNHVHYIHHRSHTPTVFSVYSFHWLEALLLSTVPLSIATFIPFSIIAIILYPLASILLNFAGHCNYRFGNGKGESWTLFGTWHHQHHSKGRKNYGFAFNFMDKLFKKLKS